MAETTPDTETPTEAGTPAPAPTATAAPSARAIVPYALPMAGYLVLTSLEGTISAGPGGAPSPVWYPLAYTVKVAVVAALMWACRATWRDLPPWPSVSSLATAVALGVLVIVAWVALDGHYPTLGAAGTRSAFNPNVLRPAARGAFVAVRLLGLVVLVPVFEELFWRSFLIRWLINDDFTRVPMGRVTLLSAIGSSGLFAMAHPEWLPALLTGLAWAWLLKHTQSLAACVVSHMTANLTLGLYVLATGEWKFW
jgi:CAAX prenyl protease-like protein